MEAAYRPGRHRLYDKKRNLLETNDYIEFTKDDCIKILSIFDIRSGGIAIYGAVIGAVVAAYVFCRIKNINTLKFKKTNGLKETLEEPS